MRPYSSQGVTTSAPRCLDDCLRRAIRESPLRILFQRVSLVGVGVLDDPKPPRRLCLRGVLSKSDILD